MNRNVIFPLASHSGSALRSFLPFLLTTVVFLTGVVAPAAAARLPEGQSSAAAAGGSAAAANSARGATAATPDPVAVPEATPGQAADEVPPEGTAGGAGSPVPRVIWRPGEDLSVGTDTEDLVPTDDVDLARKQAAAYPDNPEASFILAVALTRTSHVEEALTEVRKARKLAEAKGGAAYFDKMIAAYEEMLKNYPKEDRVRYGLAWAYYMKAYLLARESRHIMKAAALAAGQKPPPRSASPMEIVQAVTQGRLPDNMAQLQGPLAKAAEAAAPQIKRYYELALGKLDELLANKPDDIWAKVYRAFLKAEYTGNLEEAMQTWRDCQAKAPDNPAPYFFLGEGYLKQGNLKESLSNISKAIALRAIGK